MVQDVTVVGRRCIEIRLLHLDGQAYALSELIHAIQRHLHGMAIVNPPSCVLRNAGLALHVGIRARMWRRPELAVTEIDYFP